MRLHVRVCVYRWEFFRCFPSAVDESSVDDVQAERRRRAAAFRERMHRQENRLEQHTHEEGTHKGSGSAGGWTRLKEAEDDRPSQAVPYSSPSIAGSGAPHHETRLPPTASPTPSSNCPPSMPWQSNSSSAMGSQAGAAPRPPQPPPVAPAQIQQIRHSNHQPHSQPPAPQFVNSSPLPPPPSFPGAVFPTAPPPAIAGRGSGVPYFSVERPPLGAPPPGYHAMSSNTFHSQLSSLPVLAPPPVVSQSGGSVSQPGGLSTSSFPGPSSVPPRPSPDTNVTPLPPVSAESQPLTSSQAQLFESAGVSAVHYQVTAPSQVTRQQPHPGQRIPQISAAPVRYEKK